MCTGRAPVTVLPADWFRNRSTSACSPDDERRRLIAGPALHQRQEHRAMFRKSRTDRPPRDFGAPERGAVRQARFQKTSLIVTDGISRLDEQASILGHQRAVPRLLHVRDD